MQHDIHCLAFSLYPMHDQQNSDSLIENASPDRIVGSEFDQCNPAGSFGEVLILISWKNFTDSKFLHFRPILSSIHDRKWVGV